MWFKKIRKRKIQSLFIILIVALCSMLMTSSLIIMTSFNDPYKNLVNECNSPGLKLYLYHDEKEYAQNIKNKFEQLDKVRNVEITKYYYIRDGIKVGADLKEGFYDLIEYNEKLHKNLRMINGDFNIEYLGEKECVIPNTFANEYGISVGDKIKIGESLSYAVKGIYADPYNMSVAFDLEFIVTNIPKDMGSRYYLSVFSEGNITGNDLIDYYREANNKILEGRGITLESRINDNQLTEKILGGILFAGSILILFVSGIMIQYMIKNMLISEKESIGIYKTIGYSNHLITSIYLKFYLFLVTLGSVIGALSSKFISDSFTKETLKNLGVTTSKGILKAGFLCVFIVIFFVFIQVYLILRNLKNIKPLEVFSKEVSIQMNIKKNKKRSMGFSPVNMAFRMMFRSKKNTILIVITCIVSIYCVNFASTAFSMIDAMQENNYYWIGFDKHDVSLESLGLNDFEENLEEIKAIPGVKKVIPTTTDVSVSLEWEKGLGDTIMSSMIYETYDNLDMPILEGRNPRYSNEIAIGNSVANQLNKHVGDYISIYFNGNQKINLLISGTFQSYYDMGKSCRLLGETLRENDIFFQYSEASLYLKDNSQVEGFISKYSDNYSNKIKFIDRKLKYVTIMDMICTPQKKAIMPFMVMVLLLGALNIIAIVYLKNKDLSKINSIYKAIGYSSNHLLKANIIYILTIAIISTMIVLPVFIAVFPKTMVLSLSFFGFKEYRVDYSIINISITNMITLFIFGLSGIISSKNLYDNPVKDLTCE